MSGHRYMIYYRWCFVMGVIISLTGCDRAALNYDLDELPTGQRPVSHNDGEEYTFKTLLKGSNSRITSVKRFVIANERELQALLDEHFGSADVFFRPDMDFLNAVNFETEMVAAYFLGERSTGGYDVEVTGITGGEKSLTVSLLYTEPLPGQMVTEAFTQPFHMVVMEKTDLPVLFDIKGTPATGLVISYTQEGGIAGFNRRLTISGKKLSFFDNSLRAVREGDMSQDEEDRLNELLDAFEISQFKEVYGKPGAVSDQMIRSITLTSAEDISKITVMDDTNDQPPEEFWNLERFFGELIGRLLR